MQESFNLLLPVDFDIPQNTHELEIDVAKLFQPCGNAYELLITALKLEVRDQFGSPEISDLTFDVKRYDPPSLKGRLLVNYRLQLTFSCSNIINEKPSQHSYWNLEINQPANHIHFEGEEYGDLRTTRDEF